LRPFSQVNTGGNFPPASLTPVALFAAGIVDTGGKFATVSKTLAKMVEKFATVSLIPVVHLDLRISPPIFEKIRNGLNGILLGGGETDS
jgi:hypothetical protein